MDLVQVASQVLDLCQDLLDRAGCTLSFEHDDTVVGWWDPKRLEQVFVNLLSNAAKYAAGKAVSLHVHARGEQAVIVVRDHGMGIAVEHQPRIFLRFERAVGRANISGLGLGLYIVQEIVQAHNGSITVTSNPGKGAEFTVLLPLIASGPVEIKEPQVSADRPFVG